MHLPHKSIISRKEELGIQAIGPIPIPFLGDALSIYPSIPLDGLFYEIGQSKEFVS